MRDRKSTICVAGDGQCDNKLVHNAKYCKFTLIDVKMQKILSFEIEPVGPGCSSVGLEKVTCRRALNVE